MPKYLNDKLNGYETNGVTEEAEPSVAALPSGVGIARTRLLWSSRGFLARVVIWAAVLSTALAFLIPARYTSTAQLAPPDSDASLSAATALARFAGPMGGFTALAEDALGLKSSGGLFLAVLGSATVQDHIIRGFELQDLYGKSYIEDARKELSRNTDIQEDRESGVISISVTDRDPQRAANMVNEYINELNRVVNLVSTSSARRERIFLEARLKQVTDDLHKAEVDFSRFASTKGTLDIQAQGRAMVEAGATLQGRLIAAQAELEGLRQIYSNNNARIKSLQATVADLRRSLERLGGKGSTVESTAEDIYPSLRELPLLGVEYAELYRRVKVHQAVFEVLTQQYELSKLKEARSIPSVKMLDPPQVPQKKSFPPRALILIAGTALAFLLGCLWILSRDVWLSLDPDDPRKALALNVWSDLGNIPQVFRSELTSQRFRWWKRWKDRKKGTPPPE